MNKGANLAAPLFLLSRAIGCDAVWPNSCKRCCEFEFWGMNETDHFPYFTRCLNCVYDRWSYYRHHARCGKTENQASGARRTGSFIPANGCHSLCRQRCLRSVPRQAGRELQPRTTLENRTGKEARRGMAGLRSVSRSRKGSRRERRRCYEDHQLHQTIFAGCEPPMPRLP